MKLQNIALCQAKNWGTELSEPSMQLMGSDKIKKRFQVIIFQVLQNIVWWHGKRLKCNSEGFSTMLQANPILYVMEVCKRQRTKPHVGDIFFRLY